MSDIPFVFFGAGHIAEMALEEMSVHDLTPSLIVTAPDAPAGRGRVLTPSPVAAWAAARNIETLKPKRLDLEFLKKLEARSSALAPVFVVIDYGAILPKDLLTIPSRGVLNMHPSLLPRLRGPSPIRSAILHNERETGVSVMLVDEELDHGPILAQKKVQVEDWPPHGPELDALMAREGGKLLAEILPHWIVGEIEAREQNHDLATYCEKFEKSDGLLDLSGDAQENLRKIYAFEGWPGTYTFFERNQKRIRVQILDAHTEGTKLILDRVKPEGRSEMSYTDLKRSGAKIA
ncbi:methionyl-tRNA formyltransferase [Candidatus Kaiserbacteria bacterium]|nr:methionyl-tRNA formyltransferase [Candidatus Kaiserbacteria bacterium]